MVFPINARTTPIVIEKYARFVGSIATPPILTYVSWIITFSGLLRVRAVQIVTGIIINNTEEILSKLFIIFIFYHNVLDNR
jgi:hypothetical protein